jgi:hypothetical protein
MRHSFLITIDVEDWFQVENLRPWNPPAAWGSRELRVEANVHRLLDLFDSFKLPSLPASQPRCFFQPDPVNPVNPVGLSVVPQPCTMYRVPSSSKPDPVNPVNPVGLSIPAPCTVRREPFIRATFFVLGWLAARLPHLVREIAGRGHEVASHGSSHRMCRPLSDADLGDELQGSKRLIEDITGAEVAGFRAPNFSVDDRVLSLAREAGYRYDSSYNSFSPWEIDPEQPRIGQASPAARFKHYTNLDKTMSKLRGMMEAFTDCRFVGCGEYIGDGARCTAERNENPAGPAFTG